MLHTEERDNKQSHSLPLGEWHLPFPPLSAFWQLHYITISHRSSTLSLSTKQRYHLSTTFYKIKSLISLSFPSHRLATACCLLLAHQGLGIKLCYCYGPDWIASILLCIKKCFVIWYKVSIPKDWQASGGTHTEVAANNAAPTHGCGWPALLWKHSAHPRPKHLNDALSYVHPSPECSLPPRTHLNRYNNKGEMKRSSHSCTVNKGSSGSCGWVNLPCWSHRHAQSSTWLNMNCSPPSAVT